MNEIEVDEELRFSSRFETPDAEALADGFNEYGVRENYSDDGETLESIDVVFRAMEPGPPEDRNGVRITESFIDNVVGKAYSNPPFMVDHTGETLKKLGRVDKVFKKDGAIYVQNNIPNTGSSVKTDAIADFTHNPPAIENGSIGFGMQFEMEINEAGEPELVDGKMREFSATPFPGGYDDGGIEATAEFREALDDAVGDSYDEPQSGGSEESPVSVRTVDII